MKSRQKGKKKGSSKERVFGCDLQEQLQRSGQEGKEVAQGCCWVGGPGASPARSSLRDGGSSQVSVAKGQRLGGSAQAAVKQTRQEMWLGGRGDRGAPLCNYLWVGRPESWETERRRQERGEAITAGDGRRRARARARGRMAKGPMDGPWV